MAFASATCFSSQLQLQRLPRGLAANSPLFVFPSPSSSNCRRFRPLSPTLRASRPFSAVVSAAAVKSNSHSNSNSSGNKTSKAAPAEEEEAEEAVEEVEEDLPWIQEKALDVVEFTGSVTQAIPGPRVGTSSLPWILALPLAYAGLTFVIALVKTVKKFSSPRHKRKKLVNKNAMLCKSIDELFQNGAEVKPDVLNQLVQKTGFGMEEILRKYIRYTLNEKPFNPDVVSNLIQLRKASKFDDSQVAEILNEISRRIVRDKGPVVMDVSGYTERGFKRKLAVQALFGKVFYLSELPEFCSRDSSLIVKEIFGVTDEDAEIIQKRRNRKNKTKTRTAASHIAKIMRHGGTPRPQRSTTPLPSSNLNADASNLRRSTRKRTLSIRNRGDYITDDSSGSEQDEDIMKVRGKSIKNKVDNSSFKDELPSPKHKKMVETRHTPRREGLRPRRFNSAREQLHLQFDDEPGTSDEKIDQDETENGNDIEYNDADDAQNEADGEDVGDGDGDGDGEGDDDGDGDGDGDGDEDGDDEEGDEEQDGRRRYDLRNREDVRKLRPRSPRRVLRQGMGTKVGRDVRKGGSRVHKRHRMTRTDDSDDSLLVDELDQGPAIPWARGGSRSGPPWLFGGLDMHGTTAWGLNVAASGWGHQGDAFATLTSGIQTAGPSSKGGADIQPLQVDDSVSFDDIGGLSEYIDALKEMVFFPLLYPDFFASYHITPPRGVLLCGPPGTGKTLIARALACAASKAGQKVSFYMRKGADVLSKWVGEAERQLKLLFEEAQRNQPSIIFFDEIDGLAPVRSSKQEQIHNSIVSTLLALMDGLDSRGQVVLIGATNRIDAIDGALRRPGRFDREFNFPLPGCEARAEILDIHTRKWRNPPSKELKLELAASCVGYCGADLKALCTEAAIRAFREKYPQVYTSDDKFVIDVDSVNVEKYHFVEAMSTITPAAHRGAVVHSRPLSSVVAPCLQRHLQKAMKYISDIFPPLAVSSQLTKLSMLSSGSAIPLVYRPRLLLCGGEGSGLDHLGPAVLHELEKFPVHSLGLPSLLSDPSAKTPEEALVHIFGEARRTTPSILYLPQLNLWWETAHEQLRAVLLSLLEEFPSDLPILLLATSSVLPAEVDTAASSIFSDRSIYQLGKPSTEDRYLFFDCLIEAALSVLLEEITKTSQESVSVPELPKAPKVASGPKVSELKAKVEAEQHALRRLRMCLRDVCNRLLYDKRFNAFHYPVSDEDAPNYRSIIQNPMDVAKLLQCVDSGQYITCSAFLQDVDLIVSNAKAYNGDDYNGARIVSRAFELRDAVHGMLSQMDPALVVYCDKIAAQGGPEHIPDDLGVSTFPSVPVVQLGTVTRASARLRNVQVDVNLDPSHESQKRPKKHVEPAHAGSTPEDKSEHQDSTPLKTSQEPETNDTNPEVPESSSAGGNQLETPVEVSGHADMIGSQDTIMKDGEVTNQIESVRRLFVERTANYDIPQLERLYTRIMKAIFDIKHKGDIDGTKPSILRYLLKYAEDEANF